MVKLWRERDVYKEMLKIILAALMALMEQLGKEE